MKRSTLNNLVRDAVRHGDASASDGKWKARYVNGIIEVWHFSTHMINIGPFGTVMPVNPGQGSTTDRAGIRKITTGWNGLDGSVGYRELFEDAA